MFNDKILFNKDHHSNDIRTIGIGYLKKGEYLTVFIYIWSHIFQIGIKRFNGGDEG